MSLFRSCMGISAEAETPKYVVTFPSYVNTSKDYAFHLVLFESTGISLPVTLTATLEATGLDGIELPAYTETFTQTTYGHQKHIFKSMKNASLVLKHNAKVSIVFKEQRALKRYNNKMTPWSLTTLPDNFLFLQTDKAIYKPSQTVFFRVLALNRQMQAVRNCLVSVTISDAKGNKIAMLNERELQRGIFGDSLQLSDFVHFGDWNISASLVCDSKTICLREKTFTVQQCVLPKCDVKIEFPQGYLAYSEKEAENYVGFVRARYTFGKTIRGKAVVTVMLSDANFSRVGLMEQTVQLLGNGSPDDGKFSLIGLNKLLFGENKPLGQGQYSVTLICSATVTDDATGDVLNKDQEIIFYRNFYSLAVHESVPKIIKPGLPFLLTVVVNKPDGTPVEKRGIDVSLDVSFTGVSEFKKHARLRTDDRGFVTLELTVPHDAYCATIEAFLTHDHDVTISEKRFTLGRGSKDAISIAIAGPELTTIPKVKETLIFAIRTTFETDFAYFILAQNGDAIIYKRLDRSKIVGKGFSLSIELPSEAAPRCSAIAWATNGQQVFADVIEFKIDAAFTHHLNASFRPATVRPGEETRLTVGTSEAGSTVAIFAVDKSVKLLKSRNDIALDDVIYGVAATTEEEGYKPVSPLIWRAPHSAITWRPKFFAFSDSSSARAVFEAVGMVMECNSEKKVKIPCVGFNNEFLLVNSAPTENNGLNIAAAVQPMTRTWFPETWFWSTVETNAKGEHAQMLKTPHSITSWILSAFSVGEIEGFGALQKPVELTVFQPFFINLDIPYATVVRNEQFAVKAVVFNYQKAASVIELRLNESSDFEVSTDGGETYSSREVYKLVTVGSNDGESVQVWIKPLRLGEIALELHAVSQADANIADSIRKTITIEPEGELCHVNRAIFLQRSKEGEDIFTTTINVEEMFPEGAKIVEGSRMVQIQAIGNVLGPALVNLGEQVRLPTGCGEQTMVILAPNVFIYKYLESVGKLSEELAGKTESFISKGYQRELTYRRGDGGFSAFGESDPASSVWLTAFVIRCFNAAAKYTDVTIDTGIIKVAWSFIASKAVGDGTFKDPGKVLHHGLEGGAVGLVNLAAYIYITFAEAGSSNDTINLAITRRLLISRAEKPFELIDPFQRALLAYALSILEEDRQLPISNKIIDSLLISKPSCWEKKEGGIETAGYILLTLSNLGRMEEGVEVARWLISQRNSLGGFSSTQDTVVGLQALSEFAEKMSLTNNDGRNLNIVAMFNFADKDALLLAKEFTIVPDSEMILQSFDVPSDQCQSLKSVHLNVSGTGIALFQLALRFNVLSEANLTDSGDFDISVSEVKSRYEIGTKDIAVEIHVTAKTGRTRSGMVVLELGIPTGYSANLDATKKANPKLKLVALHSDGRKLIFYFDELKEGANVFARMSRESMPIARNVQMPMARVYSYYEPTQAKTIFYKFTDLTN